MINNSKVTNKIRIIALTLIGIMHAQDVPMLINYQAKLVGNNDAPITGTVAVTFRMYDALTSGNLIWTETHSSLSSNNGIISVLLGSVTSLQESYFNNTTLYIETEVTGYGILTPRQQITSTPFAIKAENTYKLLVGNYNAPSFTATSNNESFTLLDTSFSAGTLNEFIRVEVTEAYHSYDYREGFLCRVSVGINGESLTNYGDIGIQNSPYYRNTSGEQYYNHNPQAFWLIPITSSLLNQEIQIQVRAYDAGLYSNVYAKGDPTISIWGK